MNIDTAGISDWNPSIGVDSRGVVYIALHGHPDGADHDIHYRRFDPADPGWKGWNGSACDDSSQEPINLSRGVSLEYSRLRASWNQSVVALDFLIKNPDVSPESVVLRALGIEYFDTGELRRYRVEVTIKALQYASASLSALPFVMNAAFLLASFVILFATRLARNPRGQQ